MDKYEKDIADMLGSDVAEVLNEWIEHKLRSACPTASKDCSEDWIPYTVTKPSLQVEEDEEVSRGSIGSWDDLKPANIYNQNDSTLAELNELRAENLQLRQQVEFEKGKVDVLMKLLNK